MKPSWRKIQRENITSLQELIQFLELSEHHQSLLYQHPDFILNVPKRLASKIAKDDPTDPLFLQFVPLKQELLTQVGFVAEPMHDAHFAKERKLLHKYQGRALIVSTGACAMHCRYCFRKNFNYDTSDKSFDKELELIASDRSLQEIILSGGDPLSLPDRVLQDLILNLSTIPHLKRIRFHSRFPMGIPERIDDTFLDVLKSTTKQIWFCIHANHPNEFDEDIWQALKKIQLLGIPVLNQSVLLKGVNDDTATLKRFSEILVDHGVIPYYLHQLDRVEGASHFEVEEEKGKELIQQLAGQLPGFGVPKYVREIPGEPSKTSLTSSPQG
ncbi:MAG: KamA family radical SAM protein [Verrucomicrobia bacterium]|nr:KamA family radical SAM protein [Verrucomicrobiota bacterium]